MIYIISGTDREGSNSLTISKEIQKIYQTLQVETQIIDLRTLKPVLSQLPTYGDAELQKQIGEFDLILKSEGLIIVCPEYNGSMPGILKLFIDYMKFPESFEFRPVTFVGLGGRFGGLRPVEHLQQVFGYRNAFIFPLRVFIPQVWTLIKEGELIDPQIKELLLNQAKGFKRFIRALKTENFMG